MVGKTIGRWHLAGLLLALTAMFVCLALVQSRVIVDESVHVPQIEGFMAGDWEVQPALAMIPGYHLVMAAVMSVTGFSFPGAMRAASALFGLMAALVFYRIRREWNDGHAVTSAALFYACPLFFPYYFLVYTDIFSLALVLSAVLATVRGRHLLAAAIMTVSLAARQNNVIWAAFLAAYAAWPDLAKQDDALWSRVRRGFVTAMPYLLPGLVFVAYWKWNGSIVFSTGLSRAHPDMKLHGGNVWFTVFLFALLFPLDAWKGLKSFMALARDRPWILLIPVVIAACVRLHGSGDNRAFLDYFLRNAFIAGVAHGWARAAFGVLVGLTVCALAFVEFREARGRLVYPFSVIGLASSSLIENRYSIIPLALWMVFRKDSGPRWMVYVWLAVSSFLTYGVLTMRFML